MKESEILAELTKIRAVITDSHVVYTSGKHGSAYVNKDAVYPHTHLTSRLCRAIAEKFLAKEPEVVLAPAVGGIILSQWVAYHLSELSGKEVLGVYAEKTEDGDGFVLRRGYDRLVAGKKTLVVEDVLTTGGSVKKAVETAKKAGADVLGVGALCNRGGIRAAELDAPELIALLQVKLDAWDAADCPLCARGVPVNTDVGKGREFLAKKAAAR